MNSEMGEHKLAENAISTLQGLSARAHDSEQGYRRAAQDASDSDLKEEFAQLANERASMAAELDRLLRDGGTEPSWREGSLTGAAHRLWIDLRTALSRNERQVILEEVARGESAAEDAYDKALRQDLPENAMQVVRQQHRRVRETRNRYRALAEPGRSAWRGRELVQRISTGSENVAQYVQDRPLTSSFAVFAVGFLAGALVVSMMASQQSSYTRGRFRYW